MNYRIKILSFFNFNLISIYVSMYIFYPCLFLILWLILKPIRNLKTKLSTKLKNYREPSYIEQYGINFEEPKFEDFEITKEDYLKYVNIPKISFEFISLLSCLCYVIYLVKNQDINLDGFIYKTSGFILLLIFLKLIITKINKFLYHKNQPNKKAEEYGNALEIYHKIQQEKRELR